MFKNYFNRLFNGNDGAGVGSQLKSIAPRVYLSVLIIDFLVLLYILVGRFKLSTGEEILILIMTAIASGVLAEILALLLYGFGESIETKRKTEKLLELYLDTESNRSCTTRPLTPQKTSGQSESEKILKELSEFEKASDMYNYAKGAYPTNTALLEALKKCCYSDSSKQEVLSQVKFILRK
ncbi:MAG: hypothetical protein IJL78_01460 [Lachnospiraceae bacterium]|nr:hypothetical protein [Lachnospiraceae bacterium]